MTSCFSIEHPASYPPGADYQPMNMLNAVMTDQEKCHAVNSERKIRVGTRAFSLLQGMFLLHILLVDKMLLQKSVLSSSVASKSSSLQSPVASSISYSTAMSNTTPSASSASLSADSSSKLNMFTTTIPVLSGPCRWICF